MSISQLLATFAVVCLVAGAIRAKRHLRVNRGLRRAFAGLLVSALSGVAITFSRSALVIWALALLMLAGVGFLVWSLHVEDKKNDGGLA